MDPHSHHGDKPDPEPLQKKQDLHLDSHQSVKLEQDPNPHQIKI
jgi:hypothetical protein